MDLLDEMIQRNIRLEKSVNILERHKEESQVLINREVLYQQYIYVNLVMLILVVMNFIKR